MKTNYYFSTKSISIYLIIGLISSVITSCGTYKNSSYYDKDGIYGSGENGKEYKVANRNSDKYKEYFSSLREDNPKGEVFTDVDNYSTNKDTINSNKNNNTESYSSGYAGWGNNQQPINVTIYENNWGWNNYGYGNHWNYGWNWNLGWNSWYGPSIGYGWGWNNWYGPNYGYNYYGYNNYYNGYYNNYYSPYYNGHYNNYSYSNGIRGRSSGRVGGRYDFGRTDTGNRINSPVRGNSVYNGIRNSNEITPRRNETSTPRYTTPRIESSNPRNYSPTRSENDTPRNYSQTRSENSTPRSYTPSRSESSSPRSENYSTPRSYSPSSNSGGGYGGSSGGSSGGGRSNGSGGRR
jgi:hypothetical protein